MTTGSLILLLLMFLIFPVRYLHTNGEVLVVSTEIVLNMALKQYLSQRSTSRRTKGALGLPALGVLGMLLVPDDDRLMVDAV